MPVAIWDDPEAMLSLLILVGVIACEVTLLLRVLESGPLAMTIGKPGEAGGLTQLSDDFIPTGITKNGSPVGTRCPC